MSFVFVARGATDLRLETVVKTKRTEGRLGGRGRTNTTYHRIFKMDAWCVCSVKQGKLTA